jgi:hypothetical protein
MPKKSGKGNKAAKSPAKVKVKSASAKRNGGALPQSRSRTLIEINQDKELQALFAEIDADNSGELERYEVSTMVNRMGYPPMTEAQLDALFEEFDDDQSGTVNFDEFKHWWAAAQRAKRTKMTPARRKLVKGHSRSAMQLCVWLHEAFQNVAGANGTLCSIVDLERVIHAVGIDQHRARRRLQACIDELNIGDGEEIDFATVVSAFSMVGVRDDTHMEEPIEAGQQGSRVQRLMHWQTLRRAVNVSASLPGGFAAAAPESGSHVKHIASERAAERASRRGHQEGHNPRALLVLGLRLETLRAGLGVGGVSENDDSDDESEMQSNTNALSQMLHSRMKKACEVFLQQFSYEAGDVLLLSGARSYVKGNGLQPEDLLPTESALMLSQALDAGIPRSSIELLEVGCLNSIEVAITVKQLLTVMGSELLYIVTSDICVARAQTIYAAIMPTFKVKFHVSTCPTMLVEHVDLIAEREGKLMAVLRDDLCAYLEYLEVGGVWPPRAHSELLG